MCSLTFRTSVRSHAERTSDAGGMVRNPARQLVEVAGPLARRGFVSAEGTVETRAACVAGPSGISYLVGAKPALFSQRPITKLVGAGE